MSAFVAGLWIAALGPFALFNRGVRRKLSAGLAR
jgi:hypothetical protein